MRAFVIISVVIAVLIGGTSFALIAAHENQDRTNRQRDREEQIRQYEAYESAKVLREREEYLAAPAKAAEAKWKSEQDAKYDKIRAGLPDSLRLGASISDISKVLGSTPSRTITVPYGDVLPDFGIIAQEKLVICEWRISPGFVFGDQLNNVIVIFSHSRNAAIDKKVW